MKNFILRVGLPRSTKTYHQVKDLYKTLLRNRKWFETGKVELYRKVVTNIELCEDLKEEFKDYYVYFAPEDVKAFEELVIRARNSDIFLDEISNYFDADNHQSIPLSYKVFLNQYAKRGNTIHANTQDGSQLYSRARRKITNLYHHVKIISSREPSPTMPKIRNVWGLYIVWSSKYIMEADGALELKRDFSFPSFHFINAKYTNMYNTTQEIPKLLYQTLGHYEYFCNDCDFKKITHK